LVGHDVAPWLFGDNRRLHRGLPLATNLQKESYTIKSHFSGVYINGLFKSGEQCKQLDMLLPKDPDIKPRKLRISQATQQYLSDALAPRNLIGER
jgi:hypothetical protein